jgi:uncharacterized protein (DUF1697 family)
VRTYVALLRGINVGGNNVIRMSDLKHCFQTLSYDDVETYINSGNVVFRSSTADERQLEAEIEAALEQRLSLAVRVLVRDLDQMTALVDEIGRTWTDDAGQRQTVLLLAPEIDSEGVLKDLKPNADVETVHYCPGALLWSASKRDLARSGVLKVNRTALYQAMTVRNPRTVRGIHELMLGVDRR